MRIGRGSLAASFCVDCFSFGGGGGMMEEKQGGQKWNLLMLQ